LGFLDDYTEEILESLNQEIDRLQALYTTMAPILKLIVQREQIKSDMEIFEHTASDPKRFFSREAGRLLKEEKFRRMVSKDFPKLTEQLHSLLAEWEKKHGMSFSSLSSISLSFSFSSLFPLINENESIKSFMKLFLFFVCCFIDK
jgi:hypothetical protein